MTDTVEVIGDCLTAAADSRLIHGRLLPYGSPGRTNLGRVTVAAGVVAPPDDVAPMLASLEHPSWAQPTAARFRRVYEVVDGEQPGLWAEWSASDTPHGDRLLAEVRSGERNGVSVEVHGPDGTGAPTIRGGALVAGRLTGCSFPVHPAFDEARVAMMAADFGPDVTLSDADLAAAAQAVTDAGDAGPAALARAVLEAVGLTVPTTDPAPPTPGDAPVTAAAHTPVATPVPTAAVPAGTPMQASDPNDPMVAIGGSKRAYFQAAADAVRTRDKALLAAINNIPGTGAGSLADQSQPQWLGELWSGTPYQRRITPLVGSGTVTEDTIAGWRWTTKPQGGAYAGNLAEVPSNAVAIETYDVPAERWAGAHKIDRKYRDFGKASVFQSYYEAMSEDYRKDTDQLLALDLVTAAHTVTPGAVPGGVNPAAALLVDLALDIIDIGTPSFALLAKDLYRSLALTPRDQVLEFLTMSMNLEQGSLAGFTFVPVPTTILGDGTALVGARQAATFHELGGESPVRAEALDVSHGGVDCGLFGYHATVIHDERALAVGEVAGA